jgi:peroxiredoxin
MSLLNNGVVFPTLAIPAVGGGEISLPGDLAGTFGVVLIYRGAWCPFCNQQLADFGAKHAALVALGVKVVAFSVDSEATTEALAAEHGLKFPIGHSADAATIAAATGGFTNANPVYLQPAGFILGPDGVIMSAVYATNAVGRLMADEVLGLVGYIKSKMAA